MAGALDKFAKLKKLLDDTTDVDMANPVAKSAAGSYKAQPKGDVDENKSKLAKYFRKR